MSPSAPWPSAKLTWSPTVRWSTPAATDRAARSCRRPDQPPTSSSRRTIPTSTASTAGSSRLHGGAEALLVGGHLRAQVLEGGRIRQGHAVDPEAPGRVEGDDADEPAVALGAVDAPVAVGRRLQQLEALGPARQAERLDLDVVLVRPEVRRRVVGLALVGLQEDVAAGELPVLGGDGPVLDPDRIAAGQGMRPGDDVA